MKRLFLSLSAIFILIGSARTQKVPDAGELIITEIMSNPAMVSDTKGEWFEVLNTTGNSLQINGLEIKDSGSNSHIIDSESPLIVDPGQVYVFAKSGNPDENGGVRSDYVYNGFSLSNGEDEIILALANGTIIDEVCYTDGWPLSAGISMEVNAGFLDHLQNDQAEHWVLASETYGDGDLGTPGVIPGVSSILNHPARFASIRCYPNPCHDQLNVSVEFTKASDGIITVTNMMGQNIPLDTFSSCHRIDRTYSMEKWTAGLYFLTVITYEGSRSFRLIIDR